MGEYKEIHYYNRDHTENYNHRVFSFVRWSDEEKLIIISNFDSDKSYEFDLKLPNDVIRAWHLTNGSYQTKDQLFGEISAELKVDNGLGIIKLKLDPLVSLILKVTN